MVVSGTPACTAATPQLWRRPRGHAWGPAIPAWCMRSATWWWAAWRLMVHSAAAEPRALACARRMRWHQVDGIHQLFGHRNGSPVLFAALQRGKPDLSRLEVDVAPAQRERFAHAATGHRERSGERLHRRLWVCADRAEEARALDGGEVLATAGVDEGGFRCVGGRHWASTRVDVASCRDQSWRCVSTNRRSSAEHSGCSSTKLCSVSSICNRASPSPCTATMRTLAPLLAKPSRICSMT